MTTALSRATIPILTQAKDSNDEVFDAFKLLHAGDPQQLLVPGKVSQECSTWMHYSKETGHSAFVDKIITIWLNVMLSDTQ